MARAGLISGLLGAVAMLGACKLVLGIDDVSSATGPDGGQRAQGVSREPDADAAGTSGDSGALPPPRAGSTAPAATTAGRSASGTSGASSSPAADGGEPAPPEAARAALDAMLPAADADSGTDDAGAETGGG